jgi:outer membrane protein assembly factor BamB
MGMTRRVQLDLRRAVAAMAVVGATGVLLVGCGGADPQQAGDDITFDDCATSTTGPASIVGLDPTTGEQRFQRPAGGRGQALAVDGVLVAAGDEGFAGYDPATGQALWCLPPGDGLGPIRVSDQPMVVGDLFVRTSGGRAEGLDVHTGQVRWSTPVPSGQRANIEVHGDQVVVLGDRVGSWPYPEDMRQAVLARLDGRTGAPVEGPPDEAWLVQRTADSMLVVLDSFDTFVVSDPDGTERWRSTTPLTSSVVLDGDLVLVASVGDRGARVRALSSADGSTVWEDPDVEGMRMFVAGDAVYVAGPERLVALDRATGSPRFEQSYETFGRDGRFSEPGYFSGLASCPTAWRWPVSSWLRSRTATDPWVTSRARPTRRGAGARCRSWSSCRGPAARWCRPGG